MLLTLDHLEIRKWSFTYQFYSISPRNYVVGVSKKVAEPLRYFQPYEKKNFSGSASSFEASINSMTGD